MEIIAGKKLRLSSSGKKIMTDNQIKNFIMYYERITKHMLFTLDKKAKFVIKIDNKHRFKSIKIN